MSGTQQTIVWLAGIIVAGLVGILWSARPPRGRR